MVVGQGDMSRSFLLKSSCDLSRRCWGWVLPRLDRPASHPTFGSRGWHGQLACSYVNDHEKLKIQQKPLRRWDITHGCIYNSFLHTSRSSSPSGLRRRPAVLPCYFRHDAGVCSVCQSKVKVYYKIVLNYTACYVYTGLRYIIRERRYMFTVIYFPKCT